MNELKWKTTESFPGFFHKKDVTQMASGALILGSKNVLVGDEDQVEPRKGSTTFASLSGTTSAGKTLHSFKKYDNTAVLLATAGTVVEYYHPTTGAFENLMDGYTDGKIFGFANHTVNTEGFDFLYGCNAFEDYFRWNGAYATLSGTYSGGESTITVNEDILETTVMYSGTASSVTTTTIDIAANEWDTDLWIGWYVHITSGAQSGKISKITDTDANTITFDTISGLSGTPTFEIRRMLFDEDQKRLRVGTTTVTYTGYGSINSFTGATSMPAASDGDAVCQGIILYPDAPRGNILKVSKTRMYVAGIRSSGNAEVTKPGSSSSVHYSAIADATDFKFTETRAADEGGIIDVADDGGGLTSLAVQEDVIYAMKEDNIHTITFTQDGNDLPEVNPLIGESNIGAVNHLGTVKTDTDVFYLAKDNVIRSVRRPEITDFARPVQLSDPIKKFVDSLGLTSGASVYYKSRIYIACTSSGGSHNDIVLVYDFEKQLWHAPYYGWAVADWAVHNGNLYFISSVDATVYQAETTNRDDSGNPYEAVARFAYDNGGLPTNQKEHSLVLLEMYVGDSTTVDIVSRYNYIGGSGERSTTLSGTDTAYIVASPNFVALGLEGLGLDPLGATDEEADSLTDLNKMRVYLTTTQLKYFEHSLEVSTNDEGANWALIRYSINMNAVPIRDNGLDKKLA